MFPSGGTKISDLKSAGDSYATIALGTLASAPAAKELDRMHKVPCEIIDLPIGLKATDRFINKVRQVAGISVPDEITEERGRMVDFITDMQQYFYGKKFALYGDPDQLLSLTEFLVDLDMVPVAIITGTPSEKGRKWEKRVKEIIARSLNPEAIVKVSDIYYLHQIMKNEKIDLLIGNTYGKYISRDDDVPFIRFGFPILDRVGHTYFPTVGYKGGMRLLEKITDTLLDRKDRDAPEESFELVM
jgi:nitrogenase molybdenum-iron protein beta chain